MNSTYEFTERQSKYEKVLTTTNKKINLKR